MAFSSAQMALGRFTCSEFSAAPVTALVFLVEVYHDLTERGQREPLERREKPAYSSSSRSVP